MALREAGMRCCQELSVFFAKYERGLVQYGWYFLNCVALLD